MINGTEYMYLYFTFTTRIRNVLFHGWSSSNKSDLLGICCAMAALVFCVELLRTLSEYLSLRMKAGPLSLVASVAEQSETSPLLRALQIPPSEEHTKKYKLKLHLVKSLLVPVQLFLGYMLMLAVMTYNAWILVTVSIASGLIFWLFSFCRELIREKFDSEALARQSNQNELRQQEVTSSPEESASWNL